MKLDTAIGAGVDFLLSKRARDGWWEDFNGGPGPSDEWVTGYVGAALAGVPGARAAEAAREAWRVLSRRRWWSGGWGWNAKVPADADSTQCALRLAWRVGDNGSIRVRRGRRFLARHIGASGGIATYTGSHPGLHFLAAYNIRNVLRRQPRLSFRGWSAEHVCVTAAAAGLAEINARTPVRSYLRSTQARDGGWHAYWWSDPEYATALAAEALATNAQAEDGPRLQSAFGWADRRLDSDGAVRSAIQPDGSPFATAWCLRLLALAPDQPGRRERLEKGLDWLLHHQRADGSWTPSAALRVPPPDLVDAERLERWTLDGWGWGRIRFDQNGIFTTATVVDALRIVSARLAKARGADWDAS